MEEQTHSNGEDAPLIRKKVAALEGVGVISLAVICFFTVSGGPWGTEQITSSAGPAVALPALIITPWLWAFPIALLTAGLSTAMPHDGGYVVWTEKALGRFAAFLEGAWTWCAGVMLNALYPVICLDSLEKAGFPGLLEPGTKLSSVTRTVATTGMVLVLSTLNAMGITVITPVLIGIGIVGILPFLLMSLLAFPNSDYSQWGEVRAANETSVGLGHVLSGDATAEVDWAQLAQILFWAFNGFHRASTFAGEVENPSRTYKRALAGALIIAVGLSCLVHAMGAAHNDPRWLLWSDGSFSSVAESVADDAFGGSGEWLGVWVLLAVLTGAAAMFVAELFVDSYQLLGMAELALAPAVFEYRHPKLKSPIVAIVASLVSVLIVAILGNFESIIAAANVVSAASLLLLLLSAVVLRARNPELFLNTAADTGTLGFVFMVGAPTTLLLLVMGTALISKEGIEFGGLTVLLILISLLGAPLLFWLASIVFVTGDEGPVYRKRLHARAVARANRAADTAVGAVVEHVPGADHDPHKAELLHGQVHSDDADLPA